MIIRFTDILARLHDNHPDDFPFLAKTLNETLSELARRFKAPCGNEGKLIEKFALVSQSLKVWGAAQTVIWPQLALEDQVCLDRFTPYLLPPNATPKGTLVRSENFGFSVEGEQLSSGHGVLLLPSVEFNDQLQAFLGMEHFFHIFQMSPKNLLFARVLYQQMVFRALGLPHNAPLYWSHIRLWFYNQLPLQKLLRRKSK